MRVTCVVVCVLVACFVVVGSSDAADDAAGQKKPAQSKWVQAMEKTFKNISKVDQ
mgnify:CR=1 FL=1